MPFDRERGASRVWAGDRCLVAAWAPFGKVGTSPRTFIDIVTKPTCVVSPALCARLSEAAAGRWSDKVVAECVGCGARRNPPPVLVRARGGGRIILRVSLGAPGSFTQGGSWHLRRARSTLFSPMEVFVEIQF